MVLPRRLGVSLATVHRAGYGRSAGLPAVNLVNLINHVPQAGVVDKVDRVDKVDG